MLPTTRTAFKSILSTDPTIDGPSRARIIQAIDAKTHPESRGDRIIRRHEVAQRMAVSLRTIDTLHNQGVLKKITFPGRRRAAGFRLSDVESLLAGRAE